MSKSRLKAHKKLSNQNQWIEPGVVLVCGELPRTLTEDRLVPACSAFLKLGWLEEGRLLAMEQGDKYILVLNLLSADEAARVRENFARNPVADISLCDPPLNIVIAKSRPFGLVLPTRLSAAVTNALAADPDILEASLRGTAARMDLDPDGDYIFPNLPPELYEAVKAAQRKKPM
jgi:hypothetical protein